MEALSEAKKMKTENERAIFIVKQFYAMLAYFRTYEDARKWMIEFAENICVPPRDFKVDEDGVFTRDERGNAQIFEIRKHGYGRKILAHSVRATDAEASGICVCPETVYAVVEQSYGEMESYWDTPEDAFAHVKQLISQKEGEVNIGPRRITVVSDMSVKCRYAVYQKTLGLWSKIPKYISTEGYFSPPTSAVPVNVTEEGNTESSIILGIYREDVFAFFGTTQSAWEAIQKKGKMMCNRDEGAYVEHSSTVLIKRYGEDILLSMWKQPYGANVVSKQITRDEPFTGECPSKIYAVMSSRGKTMDSWFYTREGATQRVNDILNDEHTSYEWGFGASSVVVTMSDNRGPIYRIQEMTRDVCDDLPVYVPFVDGIIKRN